MYDKLRKLSHFLTPLDIFFLVANFAVISLLLDECGSSHGHFQHGIDTHPSEERALEIKFYKQMFLHVCVRMTKAQT